jgi:hypothetical protein
MAELEHALYQGADVAKCRTIACRRGSSSPQRALRLWIIGSHDDRTAHPLGAKNSAAVSLVEAFGDDGLVSDLLEEVRGATNALSELALKDGVLWPRMSAALRATCEDVQRRLTSKELGILLVGPSDAKRVLVNTAVGEGLLRPEAREPLGIVLVRHGDEAHYTCELRDGATLGLSSAVREKTRAHRLALRRAERELADAERDLQDLQRRVVEVRARRTVSRRPAPLAVARTLARKWIDRIIALVAFLISLLERKRKRTEESTVALLLPDAVEEPPPLSTDDRFLQIVELERALLDAEPRVERAKTALEQARADTAAHDAERASLFIAEVHALTDAEARGGEIVEIGIDHPSALLPPGLLLVDAPPLLQSDAAERDAAWKRVRDDLGGCIVISPGGRANILAPDLVARLRPIAPHGVRGLVPGAGKQAHAELAARLRAELPGLFARIREESPIVVAAFVTRTVRDRLVVLTKACVTTAAEIEGQIGELEKRWAASAASLRTKILAGMKPTIDGAAEALISSARSALRTRIADLTGEWRDAIAACESRASVDACIAQVNASAPARFRTVCDDLAERMGKDAQAAGDSLQRSLFEKLRLAGEGESAVIMSVPPGLADDVPPSVRDAPLVTTHDAFERKRVQLGLGGAAAGAALGTLIFPGIGTAVGAMVGVLAGLVEGTGSLKQRAIVHVQAHGAAVEDALAAQLDAAAVARDLEASLDATIEAVLPRLFEENERTVARERKKLEELARIRAVLTDHEARFIALAGRAESALQALAVARAH